VVGILTVRIVVNVQSAYLANPLTAIADADITDLIYPSKCIIPDRHVFNLYHRPKVIILNVWIIVVARIESDIHESVAYGCGLLIGRQIKVELPIRVNRKGDAHLVKHERISVAVDVCITICH
jgi:hypothetical protein